ncbi:hypothetical protein BDW59DRAFT_80369 [Aspergillus cavernicola]|uniref:Uncharacterized protein n=1 Tax=Aspergillus cavernicola TaxID=176166 RepID=A0ABR4IAV2_9EURO
MTILPPHQQGTQPFSSKTAPHHHSHLGFYTSAQTPHIPSTSHPSQTHQIGRTPSDVPSLPTPWDPQTHGPGIPVTDRDFPDMVDCLDVSGEGIVIVCIMGEWVVFVFVFFGFGFAQ